jgi:hypothetical protein
MLHLFGLLMVVLGVCDGDADEQIELYNAETVTNGCCGLVVTATLTLKVKCLISIISGVYNC